MIIKYRIQFSFGRRLKIASWNHLPPENSGIYIGQRIQKILTRKQRRELGKDWMNIPCILTIWKILRFSCWDFCKCCGTIVNSSGNSCRPSGKSSFTDVCSLLKKYHFDFDPLTPGTFLQKMSFLDILMLFKLDLGQISFNPVENAFATQQVASLATSIAFYHTVTRVCVEINILRRESDLRVQAFRFLDFFFAFLFSPFLLFTTQWLTF